MAVSLGSLCLQGYQEGSKSTDKAAASMNGRVADYAHLVRIGTRSFELHFRTGGVIDTWKCLRLLY